MATYEYGQYVNIVGGTYRGKAAVVVKQCNIKVRVRLLDSMGNPTSAEVCLMPSSISRSISIDNSLHSNDSRSHATDVTYASSIGSRTVYLEMPRQQQVQPQQQWRPQHETQVTSSESFLVDQRVKVVGGSYQGHTGKISRLCPVKIYVTLDRDGRDVCIYKSSIRALDGSSEQHSLPNRMTASTPPPSQTYNDSRANNPVTERFERRTNNPATERVESRTNSPATEQVESRANSFDEPIPSRTTRVPEATASIPPVAVFSMDRAQRNETAQVRSNDDRASVASGTQYQRRRSRSNSIRSIPVVSPSTTSSREVFHDAEDEEFFDASPQQRDEASVAIDAMPSRRIAADSPRSVTTVLSNDGTFHSTSSHQPGPAVVSDDDDDDNHDDEASYMSIDDFYQDFDGNDEPEEDFAPSAPPPSQSALLPRACFSRYEQRPAHPNPYSELIFAIDKIIMLPPGTTKKRNTFASHLFGGRILEIEVPFTRSVNSVDHRPYPTVWPFDGCIYHLFSSKIRESNSGSGGGRGQFFQQTRRVGLLYVDVNNLQEELEKIAAFSKLSTRKAVARLELFQSPARNSNRKARDFLIFDDLKSSMFEKIPERANEGCGFIPRQFIERFLGSHAVGKRTFALQVRIFAPQLGIFKGMLMEKPGITKIQLPESMEKVGPSLLADAADWACLIVTSAGIHPGSNNVIRGNILNGKAPPRTWDGSQSKLSPMIKTLFQALNVPPPILRAFSTQASRDRNIVEHANLVGVADPTDALPEGHIFVTGLTNKCRERSLQHIFVTRFPCTEPNDGCLLPVVTSKPDGMQSSHWEWLNGLAFGAIIFANPRPGCAPIPTTIAGGDLDGDLYFVTWNEGILSSLRTVLTNPESPTPVVSRELERHLEQDEPSFNTHNDNWLKEAQAQMADLITAVHRQSLIGKLYTAWHKRVLVSDFGLDSLSFGNAFKEALDILKHGGLVTLPLHLWQEIPQHLHRFLTA